MQPVNLVLSGGGIRGVAHLGAVKALREKGMVIEAISGVSSGAIAGAFIAGGFSPEEALSIVKSRQLLYYLRPRLNGGLFSVSKIGEVLHEYFPHDSFEKLNLPLIVSCSDLTGGHSGYFSKGKLIAPLLASLAIPMLFEPVTIEGDQLVDGSFLNNMPVEPFLEDDVTLIGIHVNPWIKGLHAASAFQVMERVVALGAWQTVKNRKSKCNLFIEPPSLSDYGMFDHEKIDEIFEIGYQYTLKRLSLKNPVIHQPLL
jgi:NTE family protein